MTESATPETKVLTRVAATASAAALACGVCCVLPFAVPAALTGIFTGAFGFVEKAYPWMTGAAVVSVAAGWFSIFHRVAVTGARRPALSTLALMVVATVVMAVDLVWPSLEGPLEAMLR